MSKIYNIKDLGKEHTKSRVFGCSLPVELANQLDVLRGDIPRSLFIRRIIESVMRRRGIALSKDDYTFSSTLLFRDKRDGE